MLETWDKLTSFSTASFARVMDRPGRQTRPHILPGLVAEVDMAFLGPFPAMASCSLGFCLLSFFPRFPHVDFSKYGFFRGL